MVMRWQELQDFKNRCEKSTALAAWRRGCAVERRQQAALEAQEETHRQQQMQKELEEARNRADDLEQQLETARINAMKEARKAADEYEELKHRMKEHKVTVIELGDEWLLLAVLSQLIEQPFYEELRTKQQLGYIVQSGISEIANTVQQRTFCPHDRTSPPGRQRATCIICTAPPSWP